ncbi:hypothetical protein EYF80_061314 [Liparis tanakae]|uniref:Uncharacterized protein n=1 Tax=Liparis tanakae TaxID=230148 RepID=A0A4Z2EIG2_9TELE|nr:hypothetical protein EYF80_061314 [Liparis tanakae]
MGLKEATLTTDLDQNPCGCAGGQPIDAAYWLLDCSVQQSVAGAAASSYRTSAGGMERELAAAERIARRANGRCDAPSLRFLRENIGSQNL